ncbi:MAG: PAS domain S-box protein, partial [bacterium]
IGQPLDKLFPPEISQRQLSNIQKVFDSGKPLYVEDIIQFPDSEMHQCTHLSPLQTDQGEFNAVMGISRNVTKCRRLEETLRQSEERFRKIFEEGPLGIVLIDQDFRFVDVNTTYLQMLGYSKKELIHQKFLTIIHPDDVDSSVTRVERLFKGEVPSYQIEKRYIKKNGNIFWGRLTATSFRSLQNSLYCIGMLEDISVRKQAEKALKEQVQRNKIILQTTTDGYVLLDREGRLVEVNDAYCNMIGYSREELIGMNIRQLEARFTLEEIEQRIEKIVKQGSDCFETKHRRKDGKNIDLDVSIIIMRSEEASLIAGFARDITERKEAEQTQAKALKDLKTANQELQDFVNIVSHDLKVPLHSLSSLVEWLSTDHADELDEEGKGIIDLLKKNVKLLQDRTDALLQYSGIEQIRAQNVHVDFNRLVSEMIDMIAPPEHIEIILENELPVIWCDKIRLEEVFQNLLDNAVRFIDKAKGEIKVGCVKEGDFWVFRVTDNGVGIQKKHFDRIFQIFQTLSPADKSESTGLGLAIVRKVIEMSGGRVWVESEPGRGSTFFFTLPIKK